MLSWNSLSLQNKIPDGNKAWQHEAVLLALGMTGGGCSLGSRAGQGSSRPASAPELDRILANCVVTLSMRLLLSLRLSITLPLVGPRGAPLLMHLWAQHLAMCSPFVSQACIALGEPLLPRFFNFWKTDFICIQFILRVRLGTLHTFKSSLCFFTHCPIMPFANFSNGLPRLLLLSALFDIFILLYLSFLQGRRGGL